MSLGQYDKSDKLVVHLLVNTLLLVTLLYNIEEVVTCEPIVIQLLLQDTNTWLLDLTVQKKKKEKKRT